MAYDVTSYFVDQTQVLNPDNLVRKFLIGTSDYSDRVSKWPTIKKSWNDIRPANVKLTLANQDNALSFFRDDKTNLEKETSIEIGFTHPTSGDETIVLHSGKTSDVSYRKGNVFVTVTDKFQQLADRVIGTSDVPVLYVGSNYLPADIAWYAITSYGGLSNITSSNNPDIDYDAWLAWSDVFSGSAVFMNAEFDGQKPLEVLRKIGRATSSAIFTKEDRISFHRFTLADPNVTSLTANEIADLDLDFSTKEVINKQYVSADYDTSSDAFATTVFDASTISINSYGLREVTEKDEKVWYVGSGPALDAAQRIVNTEKDPYDRLKVVTGLPALVRLIGETLFVSDDFHGIEDSYRVMGNVINMDNGIISLSVNQSQYLGSFILDTSTLDGPDVLI